jgi:hypothetical protein
LIAFAKANYKEISFNGVLDLANVLSTAAYRPEQFEDFAEFATKVGFFCFLCRKKLFYPYFFINCVNV